MEVDLGKGSREVSWRARVPKDENDGSATGAGAGEKTGRAMVLCFCFLFFFGFLLFCLSFFLYTRSLVFKIILYDTLV
jgi:hypothetical protein